VVDGFLPHQELLRHVAAGDVVCLPFEMVPSDVPLSILEAMALERSVITTKIACIPELVDNDRGFLIPSASVRSLAQQLQMVAQTPAVAQARGRRAKVYVQTHRTSRNMRQRLQQILKEVYGS
jgi:glycosyltransferase involved in cell wall biosynthesis